MIICFFINALQRRKEKFLRTIKNSKRESKSWPCSTVKKENKSLIFITQFVRPLIISQITIKSFNPII